MDAMTRAIRKMLTKRDGRNERLRMPEANDQQPASDEAKLTIPKTALLDITTTLMPNGLAWAAAEFAWHSRDAEFDAAHDQVSGLKMEVAFLQRQLAEFQSTRKQLRGLVMLDLIKERNSAREHVWALVEAAQKAIGYIDNRQPHYVIKPLRAAIASVKETSW